MVNKAEDNETGSPVTSTSHPLGTPSGHKKVGARDVGHHRLRKLPDGRLLHELPDGRVVAIETTHAMAGRVIGKIVAQAVAKKTFSSRRARFANKVGAKEERPSIKSVMQFIADASPHELDAVLSKVVSKPTGQTAVTKAAAAINQAIDVSGGDGEVNPAIVSVAGEMLTSQQVADRLKKTRQGVNEMLKRGAFLGIRHGTHWRFPSAQFDRTAPVAGLTPLLSVLTHLDPWDALSVLLAPEADRAQSPLELLKRGSGRRPLRWLPARPQTSGHF